ncbi:MAG: ACT domain-containing protein [Sarcina sp.]
MKAVITVVGKDRIGIIFKISKILYENKINILDISQTIMENYFTMIMLTDISDSQTNFTKLKSLLNLYSKDSSIDVSIQHEDIFNSMHKI